MAHKSLMDGLTASLEAITPRAPASLSELVSIFGGPGRGGGVKRVATAAGVAPRTVERWLAKAEGRGVKQTRSISSGKLAEVRDAGQARLRGETFDQLKERGARVHFASPVIVVSGDTRGRPSFDVELGGQGWREIEEALAHGADDEALEAINRAILDAYDPRGFMAAAGAEIESLDDLDIYQR